MPAKKTESKAVIAARIKEIQEKIMDASYIDNAIDRIAVVISKRIVEEHLSSKNGGKI